MGVPIHYWLLSGGDYDATNSHECGQTITDVIQYIKFLTHCCHQIAALAHMGERQTEVHFMSKHSVRYLEVLCSIHRSCITFANFFLVLCS